MKLTIEKISAAMSGDFFVNTHGEAAQIISEATKMGYIRRISHSQVEWTFEGIARAFDELGGGKRAVRCQSINGGKPAYAAVTFNGLYGFLKGDKFRPYMPEGGRQVLAEVWNELEFRPWQPASAGYRTKRPVRIK